MHFGLVESLRGEAAVRPGHHVLAADEIGEAHQPLGDQLGMFDDVAGKGDDTGTQDFSLRNLDTFEEVILVLVPGIGRLEAERAGVDLQYVFDDVGQAGLVKARAFVDAVAGVEAHPLGGDGGKRRVGSLNMTSLGNEGVYDCFDVGTDPLSKAVPIFQKFSTIAEYDKSQAYDRYMER